MGADLPRIDSNPDLLSSFLSDAAHVPGGHASGVAFPRDIGEVVALRGGRRARAADRRAVVAHRRRDAARGRRPQHACAHDDRRCARIAASAWEPGFRSPSCSACWRRTVCTTRLSRPTTARSSAARSRPTPPAPPRSSTEARGHGSRGCRSCWPTAPSLTLERGQVAASTLVRCRPTSCRTCQSCPPGITPGPAWISSISSSAPKGRSASSSTRRSASFRCRAGAPR